MPEYDYNSSGVYFITICTKQKSKILSDVSVGATIGRLSTIRLSQIGTIVEKSINNIPLIYPMVNIDNYVIMPNHVHLLLSIVGDSWRPVVAPTISRVINQLKGYVTKTVGKAVWQKSFYEHIVRNNNDYKNIWEYIDNNPARWAEDEYY